MVFLWNLLAMQKTFPLPGCSFYETIRSQKETHLTRFFSVKGLQLHLLGFELVWCAVNCKTVSYNGFVWGNWSVYCCDSACCGSSLKARCHIQRVICVYKHMATHTQRFQQAPNLNSNPAVLLLYPPALHPASTREESSQNLDRIVSSI